jgi:hypothetical protein
MRDTKISRIDELYETSSRLKSPCVGRIAASPGPGGLCVEYGGDGPRPARLLEGIDRAALARKGSVGREVLLVFDGGDPEKPVIVGLLEDPLEALVRLEVSDEGREGPKEILVDGDRLVVEAREEIVLRCGEGSIRIRKDGKIVLRGTHLLSLSAGPNRIKGGSVNIN